MSREAPADADMVSDEDLTELLANSERTASEEIEARAECEGKYTDHSA